ncbi:FKRP protein, partial [Turnix velox]|nr:FKRP protein [Turnix velox]
PGVTIILRDFEDFDNDVVGTARSFSSSSSSSSSSPVVVISDSPPYPPLPFPEEGVRVVVLRRDLRFSPVLNDPRLFLRTRHVAIVPDRTRNPGVVGLLEKLRDTVEQSGGATRVAVAGVTEGGSPTFSLRCFHLHVDPRRWTLRYTADTGDTGGRCGAVESSRVVLLLRTRDLLSLPFPFSRPFPDAIFIQAALRGWGVQILGGGDYFPAVPLPPLNPHAAWKAQNLREKRREKLMKDLGVKLEVFEGGKERWFGCNRDTPRCFGTIQEGTPQYLLEGRWTPPCCLRGLRETAKHVVGVLESSGVRYWLEGGSLLGALRLGDIIPWDYDVDLGFYREDAGKCRWLREAEEEGGRRGGVEDDEGFVWEKAPQGEGGVYRVYWSRTNRLHVDLWPFYPRDGGVMTRDEWTGHPQDVEFPEIFLRPRIPLPFAGFTAMSPNNPRKFLQLKFGEGAIEKPQYPNP